VVGLFCGAACAQMVETNKQAATAVRKQVRRHRFRKTGEEVQWGMAGKSYTESDALLRRPKIYSPIQVPNGFRDSTWSKTIFIAAVIGMASKSPIAPHNQPQTSSAIVTARGFSCKRLPKNFG
jgi:hypothetical protein